MQTPGYFDTIRAVGDTWKLINDELILLDAVRRRDVQLGHFIDFFLMIRNVVDALRADDVGGVCQVVPR